MPDRIKELIEKALAWWNKFTAKQKTIIIGIAAAVVFTFAILIWVFTKPQYVQWQQCSNTSESSEIIEILENNSIDYQVSTDGLRIQVKKSQLGIANLALGAAGYMPDLYGIEQVTSGGLGTTQSDVNKKYKYYLEKYIASNIEQMDAVKKATIVLDIPDQTGTLIATKEESSAWIQLTLREAITAEQAATIARAVATALGSSSTANITIVDQQTNLLFSGEDNYSTSGMVSSMMELRLEAETIVASDVKKLLIGSQQFDTVEVVGRLDIDYAEYNETIHEYYVAEGKDQGYLSVRELENEENTNGSGGPPGTDSNDENTYVWSTGTGSESSASRSYEEFLPSERIVVRDILPGIINYDSSSLSLTAITYRTIKETDAKNQGLLDGITWEQYKTINDVYTKQEVDPDYYDLVANATGIPKDRITIIAYEVPQFIDRERAAINATDVVSIVIIVIILILLALVVIRSMVSRREVSEEEELSVENLLQSTPESELEDIEVDPKSETRMLIEKFVDENPEAAASLLRNWLNEDWG